jgi:insertion element IS1 protein InsB
LVWYVNYDYLNSRRNGNITVEFVSANEAEMGIFVGDKSHQYWLWCALDHTTGEPLAFHFGTGEYENLDEILVLLQPFDIKMVYSDNNFAYPSRDTNSEVVMGKEKSQKKRGNTGH